MKGRAAFRRALACEAGAWATVPVMMLPIPHWLYSVLDWGSGTVAFGSLMTVIVILMWNIFGGREQPEPVPESRLPRPCEKPAGAVVAVPWDQGVTMAQAVVGISRLQQQLRYVNGGASVFTPAHGTRIPGHAVWVQGSPVMSSGQCGKCGEPMSRHVYYGRGPCILNYQGGLCDACEAASASTLRAVRLPVTGTVAYFCPNCYGP